MATHSPISYWLSLPLADAIAWNDTIKQIQDEDATRQGDA